MNLSPEILPDPSNQEDWQEFLDSVISLASIVQSVRNRNPDEIALDFGVLMELLRRGGMGPAVSQWMEETEEAFKHGLVHRARERLANQRDSDSRFSDFLSN